MMRRIFVPFLLVVALLLAACGTPVAGGILFKTADPALSIFVPVAEAGGVSLPPVVEPDPVVGEIEAEEEPQQNCVIAGNIARDGSLIYHVPGGAYYRLVKIDLTRGEQWFCTEAEAQAAGFRRSTR